jgi:hypothetical protein
VLDPGDQTLARIDPQTNAVAQTIALGSRPGDVLVSAGSLWVTSQGEGTVLRIDPGTGRTQSVVRTGGDPSGLAAADGAVWVAADESGTVKRIDAETARWRTRSAWATRPPPSRRAAAGSGCLIRSMRPCPRSIRSVTPSWRRCRSAARPPSDVTHSFERLFRLGSSGTSYYQAVNGAAACLKAPATCDLSRGIVANDRTGTVTFRLTPPDPDFLHKLTLAYADVLPASTPGREARAPLPATGPYMITHYVPGRQLLLTRNPHFREWSAAAQPSGYPDRILIRLGMSTAQAAGMIAHGQGDFMPNLGRIPGHTAYFLHHRMQLRINPLMVTGFMFLNVNTPPFNQLQVRQAVNLALDRRQIVDGYGGPLAARPTCQILPPQWTGHHRCQRILRPRPRQSSRPRSRAARHQTPGRQSALGPARPPAHQRRRLASHRHPQRDRPHLPPCPQL